MGQALGNFEKGNWVMYRPEIKVLDCTIRDGGLMNDHHFDPDFVKTIYNTCVEAGVDYMEIGYKGSAKIFMPSKYGEWKFCTEDALRRIVGERKAEMKLCVMADAERTDYHTDILPKEKSVIDVIRIATYINQIPTALDMVKDANDKGYETTINLMAISTVKEGDLDNALEAIARSEVGTIFLVDSFGSLYMEQVQALIEKYHKMARASGKEVGIHAHNNQQLAYANTIQGIVSGANRIDATIHGMGRGAGNCPLELILGFLRNPKFHLRPVLECIQKHVRPISDQVRWGYDIPYMITGLLNQHPRDAIKFLDSEERDDILKFYDDIVEEE